MKHTLSLLQQALETARNNEPIHREEGNFEQAASCAEAAAEYETAIQMIEAGVKTIDLWKSLGFFE